MTKINFFLHLAVCLLLFTFGGSKSVSGATKECAGEACVLYLPVIQTPSDLQIVSPRSSCGGFAPYYDFYAELKNNSLVTFYDVVIRLDWLDTTTGETGVVTFTPPLRAVFNGTNLPLQDKFGHPCVEDALHVNPSIQSYKIDAQNLFMPITSTSFSRSPTDPYAPIYIGAITNTLDQPLFEVQAISWGCCNYETSRFGINPLLPASTTLEAGQVITTTWLNSDFLHTPFFLAQGMKTPRP